MLTGQEIYIKNVSISEINIKHQHKEQSTTRFTKRKKFQGSIGEAGLDCSLGGELTDGASSSTSSITSGSVASTGGGEGGRGEGGAGLLSRVPSLQTISPSSIS